VGGAIIVKVSLREEVFEVVSESGLQITLSRADISGQIRSVPESAGFHLEKSDELRASTLMFLVRLLIIATPESQDSQDPDRAFTEISSLTEPEFHCPMA